MSFMSAVHKESRGVSTLLVALSFWFGIAIWPMLAVSAVQSVLRQHILRVGNPALGALNKNSLSLLILLVLSLCVGYNFPSALLMLSEESIVLLLWLQSAAWATWSFTVVVLWLCCSGNSLYALLWCGAWAAEIYLWRRSGCGVMQFLPEAEPALTLTLVLFFGVMSSFICSSFSRQQLLHLGTWTHWAASTQWEVSFLQPKDRFSAKQKRTRVDKVAKRL